MFVVLQINALPEENKHCTRYANVHLLASANSQAGVCREMRGWMMVLR
ncbi:hypothetical protein PEDI_47490 [Persicobacter diffluens]|uniref:Uncharacterized protein n=1 Tax=Persicobacter diffluens TaxID=981 RepID=A0AAN5AMV7_9BACT|nr:hypothetical protein PEDI_47490 [Persicobacter diffluens]